MQTSQIQTCNNCQQLLSILEELNRKLWELAELEWQQKKYNLSIPHADYDVTGLLVYKRILQKRIYNASYPCNDYSTEQIYGKLKQKIFSSKKCLCFYEAPS